MRHRHGLRKLNRTSSHRLAMLRNMTDSLLKHEVDQDHAAEGEGAAPRRRADHHARQERRRSPTAASRSTACATATWWASSSTSSGPRYATRNGGYLRILKFGFRKGDNAPMALVELVDRAEPRRQPDDGKAAKKAKKAEAAQAS